MLFRFLKQAVLGRKDAAAAPVLLQAGIRACEAGDFPAAAEHFAAVLRSDPDHTAAHFYSGLAAAGLEQHATALAHFERACALDPDDADLSYHAAAMHWKLGNYDAARRTCEKALALAADPPFVYYELLAASTLPGPFYLDVLRYVHETLRPRTYLEIGVETGQSIVLAQPDTRAIGIDPTPKIQVRLGPHITVHALTSDDYFATRDLRADMGGLPVELAFIDGMHRFEFALRDFANIERHCTPGSTILIHDCYPLERVSAERERRRRFWSGDIWRLVLALRKYRPDLRIHTVATAPTGLGVVRNLDPGSRVLARNMDRIVKEFLEVDYSVLEEDKPGMLALCPNDWGRIAQILRQP